MNCLKLTLLTIVCVFSLTLSQHVVAQCTHTLRMTDTFGDGWNGGTVSVSVNGVVVLTNVSFATGFGPVDQTFSASTGAVIRVYETAGGSFPTEMRVQILDGGAASILGPLDPIAGTATTGGSTVNGNCPPAMAITAATVVQASTANAIRCGSNQEIVCLRITTTGVTSPRTVTQIQTNFSGTAGVGALSGADIYYTGTSATFATTTLFGSNATPSATTYNINGSQVLSTGVNYFWLVYDLNNSGTIGTTIDGLITQFTATAINYNSGSTPAISATNPAGSRPLIACPPAPGGVYTGLETWVKANVGFTFGAPSTWTNQAPGAATLVNGSPNINTTSTTYNYNPFIDFTAPVGTLDGGLAANRQCLRLNGYDGITGIDFRSLFFAFHLTDLTRINTHCATVQDVTFSAPVNGTWHGDANGATASILLEAYDIVDFGTGSAANTWQRNGTNVPSNSNHSATKHLLTSVAQTAGSTTLNRFLGGQADQSPSSVFAGHVRDWRGPVSEIIGYTTQLSNAERQRVSSYLALKYGITLSHNYVATNSTTVFVTAAPYNNNIIGLVRDDAEGLTQKQSHNDDDVVRIYLSTLAASNAANSGTFSSDISYVVTGANTGLMCATTASNAELPAPCGLYSRLEREWKVTRTNMGQNFNMDFQLSTCAVPGSVNPNDLRLLVDDDGNFSNGGTSCYFNGDGTGIVISYTNPTIRVSNISTTHIANNATRFITIASVLAVTPLPVELLNFDATKGANNRTVDVEWTTASEINCDFFTIEKRTDLDDWSLIGTVDGAGTSTTTLNYLLVDEHPVAGNNYYRLKQVDYDGSLFTSDIRVVSFDQSDVTFIYPNPATNRLLIHKADLDNYQIEVINEIGQIVSLDVVSAGADVVELNVSTISRGVYFVRISGNQGIEMIKVLIN